jgi:hypothetical protein
MPIRDSAFALFTTSDALTFGGTDQTGYDTSGYEIEGTGLAGLAVHLIIPQIVGAPSLSVLVRGSSTSTITTVSATYAIIAARHDITAAGEYIIPFITNKRTVSFDFVTESASGTMSNPVAWVTLNYGVDWTRLVEFH